MTIAAQRIERFAAEAVALGCRVEDEDQGRGIRVVHVHGAHWMDTDSVIVRYTPASAKGLKGSRDSLHCIIFSKRKYPRKGYSTVEFREALNHIEGLKDYHAHTHCRPGHHVHDDAKCAAPGCNIPRSLHLRGYDHAFVS